MVGTQAMAQRIVNAEESFVNLVRDRTGCSEEAARVLMGDWKRLKALKIDSVTGQWTVLHGGLLDKELLIEETQARE